MLTKNLFFKDFSKKKNKKINKSLRKLINSKEEVIKSLTGNYKYSYSKKLIKKFNFSKNIRIFGMGGSALGANAIYDFLKYKIEKNFYFFSNFTKKRTFLKKNYLNLIISKSGNTLETIVNTNIYVKKNDKNVLISDNKISSLREIAHKLKYEIIDHNNFIGGRYSVLSEVGMLPAELMGLNPKKFKQLNNLVKNKSFIDSITSNVSNILKLISQKKTNSVILNYDETADSFLKWYQQLIAESLGKKGKGIFPIISSMPKDNHSLMQLYLDGNKNNFYTFFYSDDKFKQKFNMSSIPENQKFLKNKDLQKIILSKIFSTQKVFQKKKIPFRSFFLKTRNEQTLGELFTFFILETILLAQALQINPYDQPAVELIKIETKKILESS